MFRSSASNLCTSGWPSFMTCALLLLVLLGAGSCRERSGSVRIVFSSDTRGFLVDCRCEKPPLGGLARRAELIRLLRVESPAPLLLIDGGNIHHVERTAEHDRGAKNTIEIMNRLGYDLAVLGPGDYSLPQDIRAGLLSAAEYRWLGGAYPNSWVALGLDSAWVRETGGLRVGVLDYVDPAWSPNQVEQAVGIEVLQGRARLMRPHCDLVIVTAAMDPRLPETLARSLEGLADLVLVSGGSTGLERPIQVGSVQVVALGDRGRHIGCLDIQVARGVLVRSEWRLLPVDSDGATDPTIAGMVFNHLQMEEAQLRGTWERKRLGALYRLGMERNGLPGDELPAYYKGWQACLSCHVSQTEAWQSSAHSAVRAEPRQVKSNDDLLAQRRTVTGWLEKGGWLTLEDTPFLEGVQCEACHGRGSSHFLSKGGDSIGFWPDPNAACAACHLEVPEGLDPHTLKRIN